MTNRQLPLDVITEILLLLPVNLLLRFKSVRKKWYTIIDDPLFIKLHLEKSKELDSQRNRDLLFSRSIPSVPSKHTKLTWPKGSIREDETTYGVESCNGLACFRVCGRHLNEHGGEVHIGELKSFLICNPLMRTFKLTPPLEKECACRGSLLCGFGYDNARDDYYICITTKIGEDMLIYRLKVGSWRCITPALPPSSSGSRGDNRERDHNTTCFDPSLERWVDVDLRLSESHQSPEFGAWADERIHKRAGELKESIDVWIMEEQGIYGSETSGYNRLYIPGNYFRYLLPVKASVELCIGSLVYISGAPRPKCNQFKKRRKSSPYQIR